LPTVSFWSRSTFITESIVHPSWRPHRPQLPDAIERAGSPAMLAPLAADANSDTIFLGRAIAALFCGHPIS
jgi:hypothetical protein